MTIIRSIIVAAVGVLALVVASVAIAATDPRICSIKSANACGREAATTALRRAMGVRFGMSGLSWDAQIQCVGSANNLRFRCSFTNAVQTGWAFISFAPKTFRSTVVIGAIKICPPNPTQRVCR